MVVKDQELNKESNTKEEKEVPFTRLVGNLAKFLGTIFTLSS